MEGRPPAQSHPEDMTGNDPVESLLPLGFGDQGSEAPLDLRFKDGSVNPGGVGCPA